MTFDELFSELHLSDKERRELVYHLAIIRARRTIEALLFPLRHRGRQRWTRAMPKSEKAKSDQIGPTNGWKLIWQPIETAPRNGTYILVFRPTETTQKRRVGCDVWDVTNVWWCSRSDGQPTHWMPLPSPPTPASQRE